MSKTCSRQGCTNPTVGFFCSDRCAELSREARQVDIIAKDIVSSKLDDLAIRVVKKEVSIRSLLLSLYPKMFTNEKVFGYHTKVYEDRALKACRQLAM